jgi:hypothetical protein
MEKFKNWLYESCEQCLQLFKQNALDSRICAYNSRISFHKSIIIEFSATTLDKFVQDEDFSDNDFLEDHPRPENWNPGSDPFGAHLLHIAEWKFPFVHEIEWPNAYGLFDSFSKEHVNWSKEELELYTRKIVQGYLAEFFETEFQENHTLYVTSLLISSISGNEEDAMTHSDWKWLERKNKP